MESVRFHFLFGKIYGVFSNKLVCCICRFCMNWGDLWYIIIYIF